MPLLLPCLTDVGRAGTELQKAFELGVLIAVGGVDIDVQPGFPLLRLIPATEDDRRRGEVEVLPSGSFPRPGRRRHRPADGQAALPREVVSAGPKAARKAETVRTRLLAELDNPRTNATVSQLPARYLGVLDIQDTTRSGYESTIRLYIGPLLADLPIGRIDGETLDAFYVELRRCRARCNWRSRTDHRMNAEHECDDRCAKHVCEPLKA